MQVEPPPPQSLLAAPPPAEEQSRALAKRGLPGFAQRERLESSREHQPRAGDLVQPRRDELLERSGAVGRARLGRERDDVGSPSLLHLAQERVEVLGVEAPSITAGLGKGQLAFERNAPFAGAELPVERQRKRARGMLGLLRSS